jgi:hypothetical protein
MPSIACSLCEEEEAVLLATSLADGDTVSVGGNCLPGYALSLAVAMTTGMPAEAAAAYGEQFDAIAANDSRPKPKGKPRRAHGLETPITSTPDDAPADTGAVDEPLAANLFDMPGMDEAVGQAYDDMMTDNGS